MPIDPFNPLVRMPVAVPGGSDASDPMKGFYDRGPVLPAAAYDDVSEVRPVMTARRRANVNPSGTRDLSVPAFYPGQGQRVPELLQALPMVKGQPMIDIGKVSSMTSTTLQVQVQTGKAPAGVGFYNDASGPFSLSDELGSVTTFNLGRIGLLAQALQIDAAAGVRGTSYDPLSWQLRFAGVQVLRQLDTAIGAPGSPGTAPFWSLEKLVSNSVFDRTTPSTDDIEKDARFLLTQIYPTGGGAGEGPDCLIGGPAVLRALMATPSGQTGASGWRRDPRTGLMIYHYMGIPYYRANVTEDPNSEPPQVSLYAANLGPTGLCLVHAYGTAESYGLQVDENPFDAASGKRTVLVHGAYALVAWEPEAIYAITDVPITAQ